jgi:hypothetical protein
MSLAPGPGGQTPSSNSGGFDWLGALGVAADIFGNTPSESSQGAPVDPYGSRRSYVDTTKDEINSLLQLALESFKEPESLI